MIVKNAGFTKDNFIKEKQNKSKILYFAMAKLV